MSMKQNIEIDGKQVPFRASAAIPRIYRMKFHRDIYKDLRSLEKSIGDGDEESSNLDLFSLEMFENIAYVMAKHADPGIPDSPEEWLDEFNTFSMGRFRRTSTTLSRGKSSKRKITCVTWNGRPGSLLWHCRKSLPRGKS